MQKQKILIVDQDQETRATLRQLLDKNQYQIFTAAEHEEALALLKRRLPDLIVLNFHTPGIRGIEFVQLSKDIHRDGRIIVFAGRSGDDSGALASELGVDACLVKPLNIPKFTSVLQRVLALRNDTEDGVSGSVLRPIIGESDELIRLLALVKKVAASSATVLLTGASGTGKESIARAIHHYSPRRNKPFLTVNCAALPDGLLESELFGVCQGAYTGAYTNRPGKMQLAEGGTLVMDEISEMPLSIQAKLLRAIQEKEVTALGGGYPKKVDVRFVAVTNQDLAQKVREGRFREDLYFRLNVVSLALPFLKDRASDIPLLAEYFLKRYAEENGKSISGFTQETMQILEQYSWPGNIRELQNAIERAVILGDGEKIMKGDLPTHIHDEARMPFKPKVSPTPHRASHPPEDPLSFMAIRGSN